MINIYYKIIITHTHDCQRLYCQSRHPPLSPSFFLLHAITSDFILLRISFYFSLNSWNDCPPQWREETEQSNFARGTDYFQNATVSRPKCYATRLANYSSDIIIISPSRSGNEQAEDERPQNSMINSLVEIMKTLADYGSHKKRILEFC